MKVIALIFLLLITSTLPAQVKLLHFASLHTSFPDTARAGGHVYDKVLYEAKTHYNDSSVLLIVPSSFHPSKKVNLVFWFHGWRNNIDSAATRYDLINQFEKANVNAVLVLAETAKDAPDSYGGKLETANTFNGLVTDVLHELKKQKLVKKEAAGQIMLAGHSGAYRVMAYILESGNLPVSEVILFDALYAETDKYLKWIKADPKHKFINLYTDGGGTVNETHVMMKDMRADNIRFDTLEEIQVTSSILRDKHLLIIHSLKEHNDIIQNPDNFRLFLENSYLGKRN